MVGDVAEVDGRMSSEQVGERSQIPDISMSCGMVIVEMRRKGFKKAI